uniref:Dynein heavy chain linker domain-containing protein n=1 Tax=Plectus sambesii TaxID=2011161 RepID=A0A914X973_9BILA
MWQSDAKRAKSNEQNDSFLPPIYDYSANRPRSQEFRCSFTNKVFVFHPLPSIDPNAPWRQKELLPDKEVLERSALVRSQFWVWYDSETNCRREIATILRRNNYDDAVLWFWAEKRFPYDDERKPINKNPIIQAVVQECLELLARADRLGFINFYKDTFMINQRRWKNKIEGIMTTPLIRPSTALKVSNSVQVEIRRFIDDRKGLFFDNSWLPEDGSTVTTEQVRFKTIAALRSFSENIEKRLLPLLPTAKSKVRSVNIGLVHELTKAAYSTVLEYLRTLHNSKSIIGIKCTPKETSLFLPSEKAFEDLVAPIVEVCKHAMVKVSPEEHASWIGNCRRLIDSLLDLNSLSARPPLPAFASLIANEKVAEGASERAMVTEILSARQHQLLLQRSKKTLVVGLFCIDMTNVWEEMKIRAAALIADYAFRLKLAYDKDVGALMEEFRSYDRMVSFRSLDTPAMLASKAEIDLLRSQTIPRAVERLLIMYERLYALTDVITFDKSDHERLLAVAALRKKLPRLLSEYQLYFDRRLNAYTAYIKQRQSEVAKQAADAVERLKILLSFANPAETADYVAKLLELRPLLLTVGADVDELNSYEAVVGLPRTELPKISQFALTVESMMRLFTATVDFHNHSDDFFARKRTEADVSGSEAFIIHYLAELAELETELGTNRAARHFILQARNEVDRFRRNFSVARVMSCPRFRERHWTRMSEIVGFDLSGYVQATVSQICELDLDSFVSKLIPIAASAEKEASVEDQVNSIAAAWQEIFFTMDVSTFWDIALPTNLDSLMATLANDLSTLRVSRNVGDANGHPAVIDKLIKWLGDLTSLNERLRSWSTSLRLWQRLADIVTNAKGALATEFSEFRSVAKYWRRFAELIDDNQSVIAMLTWTHADCWLRIINEHLNKIVQGLTDHWLMMKKTSARLTFLSDFDLLRLMSGIPLEESLETLRQHCFRHLAKFIVVDDAIASIENVPGEKMTFEEPLSLLSLVQCRPLDFVIAFENAIDEHFCQEYAAVIADRAKKTGKMYLMGSPLIQLMDRLVMQGSTKSVSQFRYVWQNRTFVLISRGGRRQTKLKLDFVASKAADFVSSEFANRWSKGKCPLLIGDSETNRHFAANISQLMFTSIHFLNCHWRLKTTTIESI